MLVKIRLGHVFTTIDGVDISAAMLEAAKSRGVYRTLMQTEPGDAPSMTPGDYAAITAVGALTPGGASPEYFDLLLDGLAPGGLFVFSYNDHTMADPDYAGRRDAALASGRAEKLFEESGIHIAKLHWDQPTKVCIVQVQPPECSQRSNFRWNGPRNFS